MENQNKKQRFIVQTKNKEEFLRVIRKIIEKYDVRIVYTDMSFWARNWDANKDIQKNMAVSYEDETIGFGSYSFYNKSEYYGNFILKTLKSLEQKGA